jgi:hypothetical protein
VGDAHPTFRIIQGKKELIMKLTNSKSNVAALAVAVATTVFAGGSQAVAQSTAVIPPSLTTPDTVKSPIGVLQFERGAPTLETAQRVYTHLNLIRGVNAYNNSFRGASAYAIGKGLQSVGAEDNTVVIFPELMDSHSLFLTANADTIYYMAVVNLSQGPMVVEQPPNGLGTINDMWFSWIIDIGRPGPDRGEGGRYLLVPPGYDGPMPDGGFYVAHSKTNRVLYAARSFLVDNDPKPAVENIKQNLKIYPYTPGGEGSSIATALEGKVRLGKNPPTPKTKFVEASGKSFNTIPPSDYGFFEMINENVQQEPAGSYDPELAGQLSAIGIAKGKPFKPDAQMKKILTDAAAIGNAAGRCLNWRYAPAHPDWSYYPGSMWGNMLWEGGAFFETPPPKFTKEGMFKPYPPTGARTLDSRTAFYYAYTLDSPGMIMRIPGVGSQYLMAFLDTDSNPYDGAKTYKVTLPKGIRRRRSGPSRSTTTNHARCSIRRSVTRAPAAKAIHHPLPKRALTARPPSTSGRRSPTGSRVATGFRLIQKRAGSRSSACTARLNPFSTRAGGQARSSW